MRLAFLRVPFLSAVALLAGCGGTTGLFGNTLNTPQITSINPATVAPGGTITIGGEDFNGTNTQVLFTPAGGGTQVTANASSGNIANTLVTVIVPNTLTAGSYSVSAKTTTGLGEFSSASSSMTIAVN